MMINNWGPDRPDEQSRLCMDNDLPPSAMNKCTKEALLNVEVLVCYNRESEVHGSLCSLVSYNSFSPFPCM